MLINNEVVVAREVIRMRRPLTLNTISPSEEDARALRDRP
jgi:hypothetical protein